MAIKYGDPILELEGMTARMMQEISLKVDQHIADTLLRPAFEAGINYAQGGRGYDEWLRELKSTIGQEGD